MKYITAKMRVTFGLVCLTLTIMLTVMLIGAGPNTKKAEMNGRARLCETLAIHVTLHLNNENLEAVEFLINSIVKTNSDILSAAGRRENGKLAFATEGHSDLWNDHSDASTLTHLKVPLRQAEAKWGSIELRFRPLSEPGLAGLLQNPWMRYFLLVGSIGFVVYSFYFGFVLKQLDPSKAVPKRVRAALDTLAEGLLLTDKQGRVLLANESFAAWIGRNAEHLTGKKASDFNWILPDEQKQTEEFNRYPWTRAIKDETHQVRWLMTLQDCNKNEITVFANSSPILGTDGQYRGVMTSFEDVTELEQHKVELSVAKQAADEANNAKSAFLAQMSHEIRTPMNAILGYTEVLRNGYETDEQKRQHYLSTIHGSGEHLLALINDILDLSKVESGKLELEQTKVSLHQLLSQCVSVLKIKSEEKEIDLQLEYDGPLPETITTDSVRLNQALINLVGNAIKFTDEGGVRIIARMSGTKSEPMLGIDIVDTGIGMTQEQMDKIFDPFSQADASITRKFGGTGLGLSISKQLVEKMGGEITVSSKPGEGSTFSISLSPGCLDGIAMVEMDPADFQAAPEAEKRKTEIHLTGARVLVVDDGDSNRELVATFLKRAQAEIAMAENGQIAVDRVREADFDVILMDMQMPVKDGFTATAEIRSLGYTMPIIALTANIMNDDQKKCLDSGCSGFLAKPISGDRLMNALSEAIPEFVEEVEIELPSQPKPQATAAAVTASEIEEQDQDDLLEQFHNEDTEHASEQEFIRSTLPDDPQLNQVVVMFVERFRTKLVEMQAALEQENMDELADLAHWLKGSGGTVGFDDFTEPAKELQFAAEANKKDVCVQMLGQIENLNRRLYLPEVDGLTNASSKATPAAAVTTMKVEEDDQDDLSEQVHTEVTELASELELIRSTLPDDPELNQVVVMFVERFREKLVEMQAALEQENMDELADLAHWLKGSGGTVGFDDLTEPAKELQFAAEAHKKDVCVQMLGQIENLNRRLQIPEVG